VVLRLNANREISDDIDAEVLQVPGWPDPGSEQ
jgi:hypothetical protein